MSKEEEKEKARLLGVIKHRAAEIGKIGREAMDLYNRKRKIKEELQKAEDEGIIF